MTTATTDHATPDEDDSDGAKRPTMTTTTTPPRLHPMSAVDESRGRMAGKCKGKGHSKGKAEAIHRRAGELSEHSGHPV